MDLQRMICELRARQQQIDEVILALERMDGVRRRGRPPKSRLSSGISVGEEGKSKAPTGTKTAASP
jgi:hypothetical protein